MDSVGRAAPLALTRDPELTAQLHRLAAAAGVPLDVVAAPAELDRPLSVHSGVLADPEAAAALLAGSVTPCKRTLLVAVGRVEESVWRQAVALHAEQVASLPADDAVVLDWLAEVTAARSGRGSVVAVAGARGGAGASTVVAGLGLVAARSGLEVMLIDLDPWAGGLDLLLGCEDVPGLRWPDVGATRGRISPAALRDALPRDDGVTVLSWSRDGAAALPGESVREVMQAAPSAADLVLVDLPPASVSPAEVALSAADLTLVTCPADVRSAAAATRVVQTLSATCADVRLVLRTISGQTVSVDAVSAGLGIPLAGTIPTVRGLDRALDEGLGPPRRGRFGRAMRRLLAGLPDGVTS